eukprot:3652536-Amphidinium_carterae.1
MLTSKQAMTKAGVCSSSGWRWTTWRGRCTFLWGGDGAWVELWTLQAHRLMLSKSRRHKRARAKATRR